MPSRWSKPRTSPRVVGDRFAEARYVEFAGALLLRGDQVGLDVERRIAMLAFAVAAAAAVLETTARVS